VKRRGSTALLRPLPAHNGAYEYGVALAYLEASGEPVDTVTPRSAASPGEGWCSGAERTVSRRLPPVRSPGTRRVRAFRALSGRSVLEPAERQPNRAHPLTAAMDVTASEGAQPLHRQAGTRPARAARPAWAPPAGFERCQWRAADCAHGCFSRHRSR
jgi:hypothetical protein